MRDDIRKILTDMSEKRASDLHIGANAPMHYRIDNELLTVADKVLSSKEAKEIIYGLLSQEQIKKFEEEEELDFALSIEDVGRYRCNAFFQRGHVGCAIRLIPFRIMSIEECGFPWKW